MTFLNVKQLQPELELTYNPYRELEKYECSGSVIGFKHVRMEGSIRYGLEVFVIYSWCASDIQQARRNNVFWNFKIIHETACCHLTSKQLTGLDYPGDKNAAYF